MPVSSAYPCGLCYEDNRAAVYSHEAVERVKAEPERFEFVVLKIKGRLSKKLAEETATWLSGRKGVDRMTVKVSSFQKSVGFLMERSFSREGVMAELQEAFPSLQFELLP